MTDYARIEEMLMTTLGLERRPIAVAFCDRAPSGVRKFTGSQPSGCSFWRLAAAGDAFYTEPSDHVNCPVGSYTHNIALPPEREQELPQVLSLMSDIGYIRMEEVGAIPRLLKTPSAIVYAPLGQSPVDPDVVLVCGRPGGMMLLQEAATRAATSVTSMLGRPTCMAIPAAMSGGLAPSLGCVGNRIYTGVSDDEFYVAIAGQALPGIVEQLSTIVSANAALTDYHMARRAVLATA
jgi:uncharacterized protein (DUF169 family)